MENTGDTTSAASIEGKAPRALLVEGATRAGDTTSAASIEGKAPRALLVEGATRAGDTTSAASIEGKAPRALLVEGATRAGDTTSAASIEGKAPRALLVEGATRAGDTTSAASIEGKAPRALLVEGATRAPLIEFKNVTKRFGEKTVLDKVNLRIYENEITTIIGKSGTGKSVLLKHIIGLLKPDEGTIVYQGKPVNKMKKSEWEACRSQIAYLFQNNALLDSMTVLENVAFPLRQTTNLSKAELERLALKRIEELELSEAAHKFPSELSGGMQKRVALARALVTDPKIVLFDEPTTGQDPIRKNMILSMITHYRRKFGFTAVMISHDIPDVFFISDRIVILWEGTVGFEGTYEEAVRLKLPMIDEFLRSLEGFQDELTGLLSREAFRVHYAAMLGGTATTAAFSAALFSVRINLLHEALGPQAAVEVLRALGEYTNKRFNPIGGFSARHSRDEILTIFPHKSIDEARRLVADFGQELKAEAIGRIQSIATAKIGAAPPFDIYIRAGIAEVSPADAIDQIIEKARATQEIVATHRCGSGGNGECKDIL